MSPRRSSRARPSTALAHHSSSSSSTSSTRASSSRHNRHTDESVDHDAFKDETATGNLDSRRRNSIVDTNDAEDADNDVDETGSQDDEITRCICGHQEYQGEDDQADTSEGLFIQCDTCHVWQHGFCVGITDNTLLAKLRYDCERCRPELHKLIIRPYGPKTSLYLPLHAEASPTESLTPHKSDMPTKRRSTNNSRGAAYDHDAVLQRVLEESKSETSKPTSSRGGTRGRKRGSSEGSDEQKEYKRARTSDSDTHTTGTIDSSDEKQDKGSNSSNSHKKGRNGVSRNNNNNPPASSKKTSTRSKAAEKPKESQKDDSEHSDDFPIRSTGRNKTASTGTPTEEVQTPVVAEVIVPDTPQQTKRNGRANNTHGRRKGNNKNSSYRQSEDPHDGTASPAMTRDASQSGHDKTTAQTKEDVPTPNNTSEKASKPRIPQPKTSMTDMNKRVNAIMEFIQRTQLEMALEKQRSYMSKPSANSPRLVKATPVLPPSDVPMLDAPPATGNTTNVPQITINGANGKEEASMASVLTATSRSPTIDDFASMHSTEIMDILTRKLVHWQQTFGKMEKV